MRRETAEVISKERFVSSVGVDTHGKHSVREVEFFIDKGKEPTIGDIGTAIKETLKVDAELKDIVPRMVFKPSPLDPSGIKSIEVIRTIRDITYRSITKL